MKTNKPLSSLSVWYFHFMNFVHFICWTCRQLIVLRYNLTEQLNVYLFDLNPCPAE